MSERGRLSAHRRHEFTVWWAARQRWRFDGGEVQSQRHIVGISLSIECEARTRNLYSAPDNHESHTKPERAPQYCVRFVLAGRHNFSVGIVRLHGHSMVPAKEILFDAGKTRPSYTNIYNYFHNFSCTRTSQVLPHPSFVYAVRFLNFRTPASDEYSFIATGGRDCVLRVWRVLRTKQPDDSDRAAIDLCDEFDDHQNYITSLAVTKRATTLYSADWNGDIFEWRRRQSAKYNLDSVYKMKRCVSWAPCELLKLIFSSIQQKIEIISIQRE